MPQELIYTSAPNGLKAGSRGFCTVAATDGIPPRMVTLLESLSGYRHTHPPTQQPHPDNPVNWSHLHTESGDSLLSRIADAGLDYSGRSNKIAHHVLVSPGERAATGPAAVASAPDNLSDHWDRVPERLPARVLGSGTLPALPAMAWQNVCGDAGWAGVLAATVTDPAQPTAYIIYDANQNVFALIQEAMALLPPGERWQVTYSTFFTGVPPGMSCQWRCVLAGSREHAGVPPHNRVVRMDLTSPMGKAPNAAIVQLARTGQHTAPTPPSIGRDSAEPVSTHPSGDGPPVLPPDALEPWQQPPLLQTSNSRSGNREPVGQTHSPSRLPVWFAVVVVVLMLLGTGGWFLYQAGRDSRIAEISAAVDLAAVIERNDFDPPVDPTQPAEQTPTESTSEPTPSGEAKLTATDVAPETMSEAAPEKIAPPMPINDPSDINSAPASAAIATTDAPGSEEVPETGRDMPIAEAQDPLAPTPDSTKSPETITAESKPSQVDQVDILYLLSSGDWKAINQPNSAWAGDRQQLVVATDFAQPDGLLALELVSDHKMSRLSNLNYDPASGILELSAGDDELSGGAVQIANFQPHQVILAPNYYERIGTRFLLAKMGETYRLLTLQGAITSQTGMDEPLKITADVSETVTHPLGTIAPALLDNAELELTSPLPNGWTLKSTNQKLTLIKTVKNDSGKQESDKKITLQANEIEISLDVGSSKRPIVSCKTKQVTPMAVSLEVSIVNEFSVAKKRIVVTLSRFIIEFP